MVEIEGEPWFVAADAVRALQMSMISGAPRWTAGLPADEKKTVLYGEIDPQIIGGAKGRGGMRAGTQIGLVSEAGLYRLIMRSDKPVARPFQDWVTREVLPSIRKAGSYALQPGETMPLPASIAQAFKDGYARAKCGPTRRGDRIKRVTLRLILPWRL